MSYIKYKNKIDINGKQMIISIFVGLLLLVNVSVITAHADETDTQLLQLQYSFSFNEPILKKITVLNQGFTSVSIPETVTIGQKTGQPALPMKPIKILLPQGTTVSDISITCSEKQLVDTTSKDIDLKSYPIMPYQKQIPIGSTPPEFLSIDTDVYNTYDIVPTVRYDYLQTGYCRGYTILSLSLYPTEYNPVDGKLSFYEDMKVTVDLQNMETSDAMYRNLDQDKQWVQTLVMNPEIASTYQSVPRSSELYTGGLCNPSDNNGLGYDYVIITPDALYDFDEAYNWDDLINKKQADGLEATKIRVEDIYACSDYWDTSNSLFNDSAALIRQFCKDAYQDWQTQYILIGADDSGTNEIERREMDSQAESSVDTDIYWTHLDNTFNADGDSDWGEEGDSGFDYYSEMFSGSIPCDEPIDISNWLTKSFYYADATDKDYLDNAAFYGGDTTWDAQGDTIIEYSAIMGTDSWMGPNPDGDGPYPDWLLGFQYGFETWNSHNPGMEYNLSVKWTGDPPNPGWQGGSTSSAIEGLKNAINNDQVTLISAVAHANSGMSMDVYSSSWESNYHNTKPFFLTDQGCHCGDMDASDDGVLHSMLFHSDTELAFACVYNTGYGWGNYDGTNGSSAVQMKSFWDYMFDLTNNSQTPDNWQLGKAQEWARDLMGPAIDWNPDGDDGSYRNNIQSCLLFGDPAQKIKIPFVPDHDIQVSNLDISSVVPHGETQTVSATVRNVGLNTETSIVVDFLVDDTVLDTTTIATLDSMQSEQVSFNWDPAIGTYQVGVESHSIASEYDLTNNNVNKTVDVIAAPAISVSPLSLSFMVPTDAQDTDMFTILNLPAAEAGLDYSISYDGDLGGSWLSASPDTGSLAIGDNEIIAVTVDTTGLMEGDYSGQLIISSNDPNDPEVVVAVDLTVVYGNDFASISVNSPVGPVSYGTYTVNATVQNLGFYDQTDVVVNCSIYEGYLDYEQDFETSDGDFISSGDLWEYGTPTSGPSGAHSGDYCWGTDLDANYGNDEDATLDSPEIMIPNGVTATLSFWQYYDTESYYDGGNVKISTDGGATWQLLGAYLDPYPEDAASSNNEGIPGEPCFSSSSSGWAETSFDLTAYGGETIMLRWHFGSDGSVTDPGWFIDDILVTGEYGVARADNVLVFSNTETISLNAYESTDIEFSPDWVAGGGNYTIQITTTLAGDENPSNDIIADIVMVQGPTLAYDPTSIDFGTIMIDTTDSATFDIWNSGVGTLTYSLSESESWLDVSPLSGDSTGEHDTITVDVDTTGLIPGSVYHADIGISSDGGMGMVGVDMYVVSSTTPLEDVVQAVNDRGFPIRHATDGDWAGAQDFLPTMNSIAKVDLYLRKFGTPEFDLVVELREGGIDGTLLDTVVFTPAEVPSTWTWFEVDFADAPVTSGVQYFIVCPPAPSGVTTSFGYEWGYAFGNQYDDGSFWFTRDSGNLWRDLPSMYEFTFKTYGLL